MINLTIQQDLFDEQTIVIKIYMFDLKRSSQADDLRNIVIVDVELRQGLSRFHVIVSFLMDSIFEISGSHPIVQVRKGEDVFAAQVLDDMHGSNVR